MSDEADAGNDEQRSRLRSIVTGAVGAAARKAKDEIDSVRRSREITRLEREIGRAYYERKLGHAGVDVDIAQMMAELAALEAEADA